MLCPDALNCPELPQGMGSPACPVASPPTGVVRLSGQSSPGNPVRSALPDDWPARTPMGEPDFRGYPTLRTGPCPVCGLDAGNRSVLHHHVSPRSRLRLYGWCAQCGTETLWDSRVVSRPKPDDDAPLFLTGMAAAVREWMGLA